MRHNVKLEKKASLLTMLQGLLVAVSLLVVAMTATHTRAATVSMSELMPKSIALSPAVLPVRKIVCHAHTITIRHSPGGGEKGSMRRGDIFTVTNKYNNVWFYGYSERGQAGWVLAQYLCDLP